MGESYTSSPRYGVTDGVMVNRIAAKRFSATKSIAIPSIPRPCSFRVC